MCVASPCGLQGSSCEVCKAKGDHLFDHARSLQAATLKADEWHATAFDKIAIRPQLSPCNSTRQVQGLQLICPTYRSAILSSEPNISVSQATFSRRAPKSRIAIHWRLLTADSGIAGNLRNGNQLCNCVIAEKIAVR